MPRAVVLPADEAAHSDNLEWWYYHGHLRSEEGQEFGFHFVVFQSMAPNGSLAYVSQIGLTDVSNGTHEQAARLSVGAQLDGADDLNVSIGGWEAVIAGQSHRISASLDESGRALSVVMSPETPPMLHNGIGWIGAANGWTYYYSWPRMVAEGTLQTAAGPVDVAGEVWMDHQWGDFFVLGNPAGWQWFALQLDDGTSLMLQEFRDADGNATSAFGTVMSPGDSAGLAVSRTLSPGSYTVVVEETWLSPNTGGLYPSRWDIQVPGEELLLSVEVVVADQEITLGVPPAAIYYEGKARVSGTRSGRPVSGNAYAELTGYAPPPGLGWR